MEKSFKTSICCRNTLVNHDALLKMQLYDSSLVLFLLLYECYFQIKIHFRYILISLPLHYLLNKSKGYVLFEKWTHFVKIKQRYWIRADTTFSNRVSLTWTHRCSTIGLCLAAESSLFKKPFSSTFELAKMMGKLWVASNTKCCARHGMRLQSPWPKQRP